MGDLSPHFSRWEFACPCCGWDNIHPSVIAMLEQMRAWLNEHYARLGNMPPEYGLFPIYGCRCLKHNGDIRGAKGSWHLPRLWNGTRWTRIRERVAYNIHTGREEPPVDWLSISEESLRWEYDVPVTAESRGAYSLACDFQVKRREVCPECRGTGRRPAYHDGSDPIPGDPMGAGTMPCRRCNGENVAPWTLDIPAMEALNAQYEPILYGGWHLYDEECKICNRTGEYSSWTKLSDGPCSHCQGTGRRVWIHADVRGERWRG